MATLMIQGTTSDAGKSTLVAGLCRVLKRRGVSVAPFKPQNMALNSAVTPEGGEIGRSTALQALAAGVAAHSDMNPVLLKPETDRGAQVILDGQPLGHMDALDYHAFKRKAMQRVMAAWRRLSARHDVIIAEGAGSPAEVNLREGDIANMGFAEAADCPVLLVGDIDRGGVFAQLVGTLALLSDSERERTRGFVINRFRGDLSLLTSGLDWLENRTGKPVFGVLPYLQGFLVDAEDGIGMGSVTGGVTSYERVLRVVVPVLPRITNHNDLDPLRLHPGVELVLVGPGQPIPHGDVILLPGSNSVVADLAWLRERGWAAAIRRHLRYGGHVLGIGGGFQMLGEAIESPQGRVPGLGLLAIRTRLMSHDSSGKPPSQSLKHVSGTLVPEGVAINGYQMGQGVTHGPALARPLMALDGRPDGAVSDDGQVLGTTLHGLFESPEACAALLARLGMGADADEAIDYAAHRQRDLDRLADTLEASLDIGAILRLIDSG